MVLLNVIFAKPQSDTNDYKQTLAHSLTRIIQLSLRLFFKTSKHTRAADRPDDVVTSFVKLALRLQAPLLSRVCVRACIYAGDGVFVPQKPLAHCSKEMCKCDRPQGHLLTYTCEPAFCDVMRLVCLELHVDFATCFFLSEKSGKTKS